jgi:transcriptional regulator with XRE-family HTH domain
MKKFGEYVKAVRSQNRISLRKFCLELDYDPSNWSKIERGVLPPPKSKSFLERIAEILHLKEGTEEYYYLFDSAAAAHVPHELIGDEEILEKLPLFFRASRGGNPTQKELQDLITLIKDS